MSIWSLLLIFDSATNSPSKDCTLVYLILAEICARIETENGLYFEQKIFLSDRRMSGSFFIIKREKEKEAGSY